MMSPAVKRKILETFKDMIQPFVFDGRILFSQVGRFVCSSRQVQFSSLFSSSKRNITESVLILKDAHGPSGQDYTLTIKRTSSLAEASDDARYMLYNIIFRYTTNSQCYKEVTAGSFTVGKYSEN